MNSAALLARFNQMAQRPSADQLTDTVKYGYLARGQVAVIQEIAARYPRCLYGAPAECTTEDRKVYTFGNNGNGEPLAPLGAALYRSLNDVPDFPLAACEYVDEGTQIRWAGNQTGPATLYWQGITMPADIADGQDPALRPAEAHILIVIKAVEEFATDGNRRPDLADAMAMRWDKEFQVHMLTMRKRFRSGGAIDNSVHNVGLLQSGLSGFFDTGDGGILL